MGCQRDVGCKVLRFWGFTAIERRQLHPRALMGQRRPGLLGDLEPQDFYAHQLRVQPPRGA